MQDFLQLVIFLEKNFTIITNSLCISMACQKLIATYRKKKKKEALVIPSPQLYIWIQPNPYSLLHNHFFSQTKKFETFLLNSPSLSFLPYQKVCIFYSPPTLNSIPNTHPEIFLHFSFQPLKIYQFIIMGLKDIGASLPPGFRFYPSDEELVCHYLYKKIMNEQVLKGTLVEIDLHTCEPWQLPGRFFFSICP